MAVLQKIDKSYETKFELVKSYYTMVCLLNKIKATPLEIKLLAFSALRGTISSPPIRDEFTRQFKAPKASIYNLVSQLQRKHLMVKGDDNKVRVNPMILPDFTQSTLILNIKLSVSDTSGVSEENSQ